MVRNTKILLSLTLALLISELAYSQSLIYGRVIDAKTREPIPGANVFLSNTTIGAQSDSEGNYSFTTNEQGSFSLAASFIGYEPGGVNIIIDAGNNVICNFELTQTGLEMQEIVVTSSTKKWREDFADFKIFFIGMGLFSQEVEIRNPQVIEFGKMRLNGFIDVTTKAPLEVENKAMGYIINIEFIGVAFNPKTYSGRYILYSKFESKKPGSPEEEEIWKENRRKAYYGSPKHFFKSLVDKTLDENGFTQMKGGGVVRKLNDLFTLAEYYPERWNMLSEKYHSFMLSDEQVNVGYKVSYDPSGRIGDSEGISYIRYGTNIPFFLVNDAGNLYNPEHLQYSGKWGWERISTMLPLDYVPDKPMESVSNTETND